MENKDFVKTDFDLKVEKEQIVTYIDDGEISKEIDEAPKPEYSLFASAGDQLQHTVNDFLSRPIEIKNFTWSDTSGPGTELGDRLLLPEDWLSVSMVRDKLIGFQYLRCGFKIRVQVNAQPFNAGRLIVMFDPLFVQQRYIPSNLRSFGGLTGYSRVDLDLSVDTAVELDVPYLSNLSHFDLVKAIGNLGAVRIYVYSKLTGSQKVYGTIWAQAYNIDTQMATGISPWNRAKIQSKSKMAEERVIERRGLVTEIAGAVKAAAGALTGVPLIGEAARSVQWVASAVAGVASVFGWSKPIDSTIVTKVAPQFGANFTNYQGDSKAKVLALSAENETLIPSDVFGTDQDEMSLTYILSRPTYLDRFIMYNTNPVDGVIWRMPVSPAACVKESGTDYVQYGNTYLSYFSQMFRCWRGTIKYHFKVVKTIYHSARIRILFVPGGFIDTDLSLIDVSKCYSEIYDIRQLTEFEFEVPFVYNQQWMSLTPLSSYLGQFCDTLSTGVIYCEVINPLTNSTNASSSIEFLVEVSAGDDFQFAYPYVDPKVVLLPKPDSDSVTVFKANHAIEQAKVGKNYAEPGPDRDYVKKFCKKLEEAKKEIVMERRLHTGYGGRKRVMLQPVAKEVPKEQPLVTHKTVKVSLPVVPDYNINDLDFAKEIPSDIILDAAVTRCLYTTDQRKAMLELFEKKPFASDPEALKVFKKLYPAVPDFQDTGELPLADTIPVIPDYPYGGPKSSFSYPQVPLFRAWSAKFREETKDLSKNDQTLVYGPRWVQFKSKYPVYSPKPRAKIQSKMFDSAPSAPLAQNVFAMGEVVTSLRQLLRRYDFLGSHKSGTNSASRFYPYASAGYTADSDGFDPTKNSSIWDRISSLYRWQSGSLRVAVTETAGLNTRDCVVNVTIAPGWLSFSSPLVNSKIADSSIPSYNTFEPFVPGFPNSEELLEYSVPFYQRLPAIPTSLGGMEIYDLDMPSFGVDYVPFNLGTSIYVESSDSLNYFSSIGEDFSFGYLVGPPVTGRKIV